MADFDPLAILEQGAKGTYGAAPVPVAAAPAQDAAGIHMTVRPQVEPDAAPFDPMSIMEAGAKGEFAHSGGDTNTPAATPAEEPLSTGRGIAKNLAAGVVEGGAGLLNAASDPFGNLIGKPLAIAGTYAHDLVAPMFGGKAYTPEQRARLLSTDFDQPGTKAVNAVGDAMGAPLPDSVPSNNVAEHLARAVGQGAMMGAATPSVIPEVLAGSVAADQAARALPDHADAAGLIGGAVGGVGASGIRAGVNAATRAAGSLGIGPKTDVGGVRLTGTQADNAALKVAKGLGDEGRANLAAAGEAQARFDDLAQRLQSGMGNAAEKQHWQDEMTALRSGTQHAVYNPNGAQIEQVVPGDMPTTAQVAQTPTAAALEQAHRVNDGAPFVQRSQEQNLARTSALQAVDGVDTANAANVQPFLQNRLANLDKQGAAATADAVVGRVGAVDALGETATPSQVGQDMRGALTKAYDDGHPAVTAKWNAVDPDGKLALDIAPYKEAAADLLGKHDASVGDEIHPKVMALLQGAANLPDVVPFSRLQNARSNIMAAKRIVAPTGDAPAMRQLDILRQSVDDSIAKAADGAGIAQADSASVAAPQARQTNESVGGGNPSGTANPLRGTSGESGVPVQAGTGNGRASGNAAGNRPVSAGGTDERLTKPQSLVDALIAKGGIKDDGDLKSLGLDQVHHRQGGRLVDNKNGMSLEHAVEFAKENGFIPNNFETDINALKDHLADHRDGFPTYRPEDEAAGAAWHQGRTAGNFEDNRREMAAGKLSDVEHEAGTQMSNSELSHAVDLLVNDPYMHPAEAARQATMASERAALDTNAARNAVGSPGMPLAEQAELPVGGRTRSTLKANFDREAANRYAEARAATLEEKQTFRGADAVGQVLKPGKLGAQYGVADADVPRKFFGGGAREATDVAKYIKASGGTKAAVEAAQTHLVSDLVDKGIVGADGTINAAKLIGWQRKHADAIKALDAVTKDPLMPRIENATKAQIAVDRAIAAHKAAVEDFQTGVAKNFLKDDPETAVGKALAPGSPKETFQKLVSLVKGNPDALAGLRKAVIDHMVGKLTGITPAGKVDMLNARQFRKWVRNNSKALHEVFTGQGLADINMLASSMRRTAALAEAAAGANTKSKMTASRKHGMDGGHSSAVGAIIGERAGEGFAHLVGAGGLTGIALEVFGAASHAIYSAMKQAGITKANDLVHAAMLHPDVARALMARLGPDGKLPKPQVGVLARALHAAAMVQVAPKGKKEAAKAPVPVPRGLPPIAAISPVRGLPSVARQ
jgi:hypothetical protein